MCLISWLSKTFIPSNNMASTIKIKSKSKAKRSPKHKPVDRIRSSFLYSAIGDAVGYRFEFTLNTANVLEQANLLGGISAIRVDKQWPVSDDTVMAMATARAIMDAHKDDIIGHKLETARFAELFEKRASDRYIECMDLMDGRAPGNQCILATEFLKRAVLPPFSATAGGNGTSMRSMCLGFVAPKDYALLVDLSMRSALLTHPNFTAMFGSVVSTIFTSLAYQDEPPTSWPHLLMEHIMPLTEDWLKTHRPQWKEQYGDVTRSRGNYNYFGTQWKKYIKARFNGPDKSAQYPKDWISDYQSRDAFFEKLAFVSSKGTTWNGSSGHDSVIIAFDAILYDYLNHTKVNGARSLYQGKPDWDTVLYLTALHGGDSDSTAAIAGAWFGAMHPMRTQRVEGLEFEDELIELANDMAKLL
jgi:ADP-ribosylarginine hydrolase